jgi:hypothetical protein
MTESCPELDPEKEIRESDPVERHTPDLDPHLAPDPEHDIEESPPEGDGPKTSDDSVSE